MLRFLLVAAWDSCCVHLSRKPFLFTKPSLIAAAFGTNPRSQLWHDLAVSSQAFIWGFGFAVIVGIPVGLVMGWRRRVEYSLDPFPDRALREPLVALAPLLIIVFGVGVLGKAALVLLAVFPFVFNAFAGVKSTDSLLINVIRSYGGTEKDLYLKVILPSTMPYIIAGARLAIGRGLVGIIVGEFYAASEGIGFAITQAGDTYRLPDMFVGIIILSLIAVGLTELMRKLEHHRAVARGRRGTLMKLKDFLAKHESFILGTGFIISLAAGRAFSYTLPRGMALFFTTRQKSLSLFMNYSLTVKSRNTFYVSAVAFLAGLALDHRRITVGLIIGRSPTLEAWLDPYITAFNATPRIVLLPLLILCLASAFGRRS